MVSKRLLRCGDETHFFFFFNYNLFAFCYAEAVRSRIEQEKLILLRDQNQDRDAYQKLLTEKNVLESRVEALERELNVSGHHRSLSNASSISFQENSRGSPDGTASVNNVEVS